MISSTSSCGSLVIGDGRRVDTSSVSPQLNNCSILALPRHQTLAANNSNPIAVKTRDDE